MHRSKFSFPKAVRVQMLFCNTEPASKTVWLKPWDVPLSERISNRAEWSSILEKLG
jgi:hypothetical protein